MISLRRGVAGAFGAASLGVFLALCGPAAQATTFTLTDLNSTATIDLDTPLGMHSWTVDGVDQLHQQSFFFRLGDSGGQTGLGTLPGTGTPTFGTRGLVLTHTDPGLFNVEIDYLLTGGTPGSGKSDIGESIRITNTSNSTLAFRFFQYSDFDLNGTAAGDTVALVNPNTWQQSKPGIVLSETVATPTPSRWEAGVYPSTLSSLDSSSTYDLNDTAGPLTGNATWAWEWMFTLAPGDVYLISKNKDITPVPAPEPMASSLMMASGGLAFAWAAWRRRVLPAE